MRSYLGCVLAPEAERQPPRNKATPKALLDVSTSRYRDGLVINDSEGGQVEMEQRTDQHFVEGSPDQGRLDNLVRAVALALPVGAFWYLISAIDAQGFLPLVLIIVTLGLAFGFGVSMERTRGFVMSVSVATAAMVGVFLADGSLSENREDGYFYFVLAAVVVTILVLASWLIGVVIGRVRHRVAGR